MQIQTRQFSSFDGCRLQTTDQGESTEGVPVVLLHAFMIDSLRNWHQTRIAEKIQRAGRRVICIDFRGHGGSGKPHDAAAYRDRAMAGDLKAVLDALQLPQVELVGYSMGAAVAIQAGLRNARIQRMVLCGIGTGEADVWLDSLREHEMEGLRAAAPRRPSRFRQLADELGGDRLAFAARLEGDSFPMFHREELRGISFPVTVVNGRDDAERPSELAGWFPQGRAIETSGDHFSAIWKSEFADAILNGLGDG